MKSTASTGFRQTASPWASLNRALIDDPSLPGWQLNSRLTPSGSHVVPLSPSSAPSFRPFVLRFTFVMVPLRQSTEILATSEVLLAVLTVAVQLPLEVIGPTPAIAEAGASATSSASTGSSATSSRRPRSASRPPS